MNGVLPHREKKNIKLQIRFVTSKFIVDILVFFNEYFYFSDRKTWIVRKQQRVDFIVSLVLYLGLVLAVPTLAELNNKKKSTFIRKCI